MGTNCGPPRISGAHEHCQKRTKHNYRNNVGRSASLVAGLLLPQCILPSVMHHEIERAVSNDRSSALKECHVSGRLEEKEMESETRLLTELTYDLDISNT
ncbi:hypothetical protein YC2023_042430 [Brassica napus]